MGLQLETHFTHFLSIRQSIGKSAVRYVQQYGQEQEDYLIYLLVKVLCLLIPKTSETDITKAVSKFVNKAVKLKHAMAEEQALYHCYWIDGGERYEEESVEIEGEEEGNISICTFPGLARTVKNEGGEFLARAVKASAFLQSAFPKG